MACVVCKSGERTPSSYRGLYHLVVSANLQGVPQTVGPIADGSSESQAHPHPSFLHEGPGAASGQGDDGVRASSCSEERPPAKSGDA